MKILDRIKFDGLTSKEWLIYRYPGEQFRLGSVLVVGPGQACVFVKGGQICDVFLSGTYNLQTNNLPILNSIVNLPFGGQTPFTAELYFVNTTTKLDMRWGTVDPIVVIDPKYSVRVHVRAFGQFGLKIKDYSLFISEVIGALGNTAISYKKVMDYFKGVLVTKTKSAIADAIINQQISIFEIAAKLESISEFTADKIRSEFEKFGFNVRNFFIESINCPDEDFEQVNKILEKKASFDIIGDQRYATMRSFDVYEGAANNNNGTAGVLLAGGLGVGLGANMMNAGAGMMPGTGLAHQQEAVIYCPKCNAKNAYGSKFCNSCEENLGPKKVKCIKCNAEIEEGSAFCNSCGAPQKRQCKCGAELAPGAKFCSVCGEKVE